MIRTWIWINCHWHLRYLTSTAWRALPHVSAMTVMLACGGSSPPPPVLHAPPPVLHAPPPAMPPALTQTPPGAWPQIPPAWGYVPPSDAVPVTPNPAGPSEMAIGRLVEQKPDIVGEVGPAAPTQLPPCDITTVLPARVTEPGTLWLLGTILLIIGLIPHARPVIPPIRVTIITTMEG